VATRIRWIRATPRIQPRGVAPPLLNSALVLVLLLDAYLLRERWLPTHVSADVGLYVAQPLVWGGLACFGYRLWVELPSRPRFSRNLTGLAVLAGVFHIALLVCAGLLFGFGRSPYARQLFHMAENLLYFGTLLAGLEMTRAYLLAVWGRVNGFLAFVAVAGILAAADASLGQFGKLGPGGQSFEVTGRVFLPGLAESVMATFLASLGGPLAAFAYRFSLDCFEWFSPILPNLTWTITAFVGTVAPVLAMLVVRDAYFSGEGHAEAAEERGRGLSPLFMLAAVLVVALIWLNTGLLGVRPALVSGVSMRPYLKVGDVVVTKQVSASSLKVGDVVRFRGQEGGVVILHRIIAIDKGPGHMTFVTKGDSNDVSDRPITAEQIEGKVILKIPEAGWLPIWVQKALRAL
jgi:signal peptidase